MKKYLDKVNRLSEKKTTTFVLWLSLITTVLGAFLGAILSNYITIIKENFLLSFGLILIFSLLFMILVELFSGNRQLSKEIQQNNNSFRKLGEYETLGLLHDAVRQETTDVLVIGDGYGKRKYFQYDSTIKKYLNALEFGCKSGLQYKRITASDIIEDSLIDKHIKSLLNGNDNFKLSILPQFNAVYTYTVIGQSYLIIHIRNETNDLEYESNYITSDGVAIRKYRSHFDTLFQHLKRCRNLTEYNYHKKHGVAYWSKLQKLYHNLPKPHHTKFYEVIDDQLDHFVKISQEFQSTSKWSPLKHLGVSKLVQLYKYQNNLQENSVFRSYAEREVQQTLDRIKGFSDGYVKIRHTDENSRLYNVIYKFMSELKSGDTYETVSIDHFWQFLSRDDRDHFLRKNREQVENNVVIIRYLVVFKDNLYSDGNLLHNSDLMGFIRDHRMMAKDNDSYSFDYCILDWNMYFKQWNTTHIKKKSSGDDFMLKFTHNLHDTKSLQDVSTEIISKGKSGFTGSEDNIKRTKDICAMQTCKNDFKKEVDSYLDGIV